MTNACIFLISARKEILPKSLFLLNENYNKKYNHDILIFYHGDKYDDLEYQNMIKNINSNTNYYFHKIDAKLPDNVKETDLFYNKRNIPYVINSFPKQRVGYLHAVTWKINSMNNQLLKKYDNYIMIDDDSWFKKPINFNIFDKMDEQRKLCGTGYSWNHVHNRVLDTRINLYQWIQEYVKKYNIEVKSEGLKKYLSEGENDIIEGRKCNAKFHYMKMLSGNFNIYNRKMFDLPEWKQYNKEFNDYAGGFKYRWGDCEIISYFYYIHIGDEFMDLNLKEKDIYNNSIPGTGFIFNGLN
tara:strand:+ start:978 stop:1871 length:894 start_codon:yes stop_codon:yes gene_type:complete